MANRADPPESGEVYAAGGDVSFEKTPLSGSFDPDKGALNTEVCAISDVVVGC